MRDIMIPATVSTDLGGEEKPPFVVMQQFNTFPIASREAQGPESSQRFLDLMGGH